MQIEQNLILNWIRLQIFWLVLKTQKFYKSQRAILKWINFFINLNK